MALRCIVIHKVHIFIEEIASLGHWSKSENHQRSSQIEMWIPLTTVIISQFPTKEAKGMESLQHFPGENLWELFPCCFF